MKKANKVELIIEEQFIRLNQELLALKKSGSVPKYERFKMSDTTLLSKLLGIEKLKVTDYMKARRLIKENKKT